MRLRVTIHGATCGFLELAHGNLTTFRFSPRYLEMVDRPVLGRAYEEHLTSEFIDKSAQNTLPPFFQNWLPDVNSPLRELLARRARVPSHRELQLLDVLGQDLPGAAVIHRDDRDDAAGEDDDDAAPAAPTVDPPPEGPLRFSLAGMQLKFSIVAADDELTLPVTGTGGRFILKLPSRELAHLPENEYSTMTWARASGIVVPDVRLVRWRDVDGLPALDFAEESALLVERFDRPRDGGEPIHQEDLAQVLGKRPAEKYGRDGRVTFDRIGKIIALVCGAADFDELVRRLVFAVLSGNPDIHLKNWSLWYPDRKRPRLAPAYDLVSATAYPSVSRELACRLAKEWDPSRVRAWHFGRLAAHAGFDEQKGIALAEASAAQIRTAWGDSSSTSPLPDRYRAAISAHLEKMKL